MMQEATTVVRPRPLGLSIASTLAWLLGIMMALLTTAVVIPIVAVGSFSLGPIFMLAVAVAYCVAGYGLRRQQRSGGWTALAAVSLWAVLQVVSGVRLWSPALVANVAILALVAVNWKQLNRS